MIFGCRERLLAAAFLLVTGGVASAQTYSAQPAIDSNGSAPTETRSEAIVMVDRTNNIHVIGGMETTNLGTGAADAVKTHLVFNGTAWSSLTGGADFPVSKIRGAGFAVAANGRLYVFGGIDNTGTTAATRSTDVNVGSPTWTSHDDMPVASWRPAGDFGADGKLYVFGGEGGTD